MAVFNPETNLSDTSTPDWSTSSRGIPTNRAFETLFEGLGTALGGAVKTVDTAVQNNIRTDVESAVGLTNQEFAVDVPASISLNQDRVRPGSNVPPELNSSKTQMQKMQSALSQGKITPDLYWSRLAVLSKELRSRYPGYNQQIDDIIDDVTGRRSPANRVREELFQQYDAAGRASASASNKIDQRLKELAPQIHNIDPAFEANKAAGKYSESQINDLIDQAENMKAEDYRFEKDSKKTSALKSRNEWNGEDAYRIGNERAGQIADRAYNRIGTAVNASGAGIAATIAQWQNAAPSTDEILQVQGTLNQMRLDVRSQIQKEILSTDVGSRLNNTQQEAIIAKATAPIDFLMKQLTDKEYGAIAHDLNANKLVTQRGLKVIGEMFPEVRAIQLGNEISPELGREMFLKLPNGGEDLMTALIPKLRALVVTGNKSVSDVTSKVLEETGLQPAEKQKLITQTVKDFADFYKSKNVSDQQIIDMTKKNYSDMDTVWKNIQEEDKWKLFNTLTSPAISERIAKTGDAQTKQQYAEWVLDKFTSIPDARLVAGNIARTNRTEQGMEFVYNPQTYTFSVVPRPMQPGNAGESPGLGENPSVDPLLARQEAETAEIRIQKFNSLLSNVGQMLKSLGQDPNQKIPQILDILQGKVGGNGDQSMLFNMQRAVIGSSEENRQGGRGMESGTLAPGDDMLHLASGQSANPFIVSTARGLLNYVAGPESQGNYNAVVGNAGSTRDLSSMTLDEIEEYQKQLVTAGSESGAIGKYQIINKTLKGLRFELGLSGDEKFTPELQDRLAMALLVRRGYKDWVSGKISHEKFQDNLAQEWAGLPTASTGRSYYEGVGSNAAGISRTQALSTLIDLRAQEQANPSIRDEYGEESVADLEGGAGDDRLQTRPTLDWTPELDAKNRTNQDQGDYSLPNTVIDEFAKKHNLKPGDTFFWKGLGKRDEGEYQYLGPWPPKEGETDYYDWNHRKITTKNDLLSAASTPTDQMGRDFAEAIFQGQTIATKGEQLQGNEGTFDANKLPSGSYNQIGMVEDRTQGFDRTIDERSRTAYDQALSQYRTLVPDNEFTRAMGKFLVDFKKNPDKYKQGLTPEEDSSNELNKVYRETVLLKGNKGHSGIDIRQADDTIKIAIDRIGKSKTKNQSRLGESDLPSPETVKAKLEVIRKMSDEELINLLEEKFYNPNTP